MWRKQHFVYKETRGWYSRENENGDQLYFGGNPKFIVTSLVNLYWPEKGKQVFDEFMEWIRNISKLWIFINGKETATFVLYKNTKNDNKKQWYVDTKEVQGGEEEYWEDGEDAMT